MRRLGAVLAALALAACAAEPPPPPRVPPGAEIVAAARARGVARVRVTTTLHVAGVQTMTATATGLLDVAGERSAVRVEYDADGRKIGFRTSDEVVVGPVHYLRRPGRPWFHVRGEAGGVRPYVAVAQLARATTLSTMGEETVAGQPVTRYAANGNGEVETVEVWVGRDGVPVRFRMRLRDGIATTVDVERWGVPERVVVPAPSTRVETGEELYEAVMFP